MTSLNDPIQRAYNDILREEEQWHAEPNIVSGIKTGFDSLDEVLGGLHPAEMTILAARPSEGKSSLANQIAFNVALQLLREHKLSKVFPGVVAIFNPEMTLKQILMRQASVLSAVSSRSIQRGEASEEDRQAWLEELSNLTLLAPYLRVYAGASFQVNEVVLEVDKIRASSPVSLIVIDYIQRLRTSDSFRSAYDKAGEISTSIKDIANKHEVPVLALSQLSREAEKGKNADSVGKKMIFSRDSGRIEEDADVFMSLERNRNATFNYDDSVSAVLLIEKNRNGPLGQVTLRFTPHITRFDDLGQYVLEV